MLLLFECPMFGVCARVVFKVITSLPGDPATLVLVDTFRKACLLAWTIPYFRGYSMEASRRGKLGGLGFLLVSTGKTKGAVLASNCLNPANAEGAVSLKPAIPKPPI